MNEEQKKYQEILTRFQNINVQHVTNTINILLTLTVGLTAFAVNILVTSQAPIERCAKIWLALCLVFLFLAAFTGIALMFTRLEDFRRSARAAKILLDEPDFPVSEARSLRIGADRINQATQILIYVQPSLFLLGFVCLTVSVFITHGSKLR
jgi:hypothetical protein